MLQSLAVIFLPYVVHSFVTTHPTLCSNCRLSTLPSGEVARGKLIGLRCRYATPRPLWAASFTSSRGNDRKTGNPGIASSAPHVHPHIRDHTKHFRSDQERPLGPGRVSRKEVAPEHLALHRKGPVGAGKPSPSPSSRPAPPKSRSNRPPPSGSAVRANSHSAKGTRAMGTGHQRPSKVTKGSAHETVHKYTRGTAHQLFGGSRRPQAVNAVGSWWMAKYESGNPKVLPPHRPWWAQHRGNCSSASALILTEDATKEWSDEQVAEACSRRGLVTGDRPSWLLRKLLDYSSRQYDLSDQGFRAAEFYAEVSPDDSALPPCYPESYEAPHVIDKIKELNRKRRKSQI